MLKEIRYNFKSQPVIAAVTVAGTALSILLVMVVVMTQQISVAPFSPESGRDRFLHYRHLSFGNKEWGDITESNSNGPMNLKVVKSLFYPLETPEAVTAYAVGNATKSVGVTGDKPHSVDVREVDDRYFNVFDFTFVDGKPFTRADFDAELPLAVIDSNVARKLFGTENASGKEFNLNGAPYRVSGVVKPVSPLASNAYSQVWPNLTSTPLSRESWVADSVSRCSPPIPPRVWPMCATSSTAVWTNIRRRLARPGGASSTATVPTRRRNPWHHMARMWSPTRRVCSGAIYSSILYCSLCPPSTCRA